MIILGIHFDTHDSNVSLIKDGKIVFCSAEERFSRVKSDSSAPIRALKYSLNKYHIDTSQIDHLVFTGFPFPANAARYAINRFLMAYASYGIKIWRYNSNPFYYTGLSRLFGWFSKKRKIMRLLQGFRGDVVYVDHELCHVSSGFFTSGFDLSETLGVVVESSGWDKSSSSYIWKDEKIRQIAQTNVINSVGYYYDMITEILGFRSNRDAGKIMSLAALGDAEVAYETVKKYLFFDVEEVSFRVSSEVYRYPREFKKKEVFPKELEKFSREDLAAAFQFRLEEVVVDYIKTLQAGEQKKTLVLAGGVFANVKLNQRIFDKLKFENIYIHPAMGDSGCSLGAALYIYNQDAVYNKRFKNVFLGEEGENMSYLEDFLKNNNYKFHRDNNITVAVAEKLADGNMVACFHGRAEYGPRALGNRSILCRADSVDTCKDLNKKLGRSPFMPFAPLVLVEDFDKLFVVKKQKSVYTEEFMNMTYNCRLELRESCPGAVHADNTARPQVLIKENNPFLYGVLRHYKDISALPTIINTSFNIHGEPIVGNFKDAIKSFEASNLDFLVVDNFLIYRR